MAKSKYDKIYRDLKKKIEQGDYPDQTLLPSENTLVDIYKSSRNTIRRAIAGLVSDGYVQTIHGKGVRSIYRPNSAQTAFTLGEIESFRESAARNEHSARTEVVQFSEIVADPSIAERTGFPLGTQLYYLQRVHYLDDQPLIFNHNFFLKDEVPGLTPEIAADSIYNYMENTLGITIVNSKRVMTVEKVTALDEEYMDLDVADYNCVAVVSSWTYDSDGTMFEYSQSRHRPDFFSFRDNAIRRSN